MHVELGSLLQRRLDATYIGHLATDMEMDQLQTIPHLILLQNIHGFQQLARIYPELADISSRLFPLATPGAGQLNTDAYIRTNFQAFGDLRDISQFNQLLDNQVYISSHFLGQKSQLDIILVLVTVTDDHRIVVNINRQHRVQFRFRACLKTNVILGPVTDNLFHHRAHLVHFNRINDKIFPRVTIFRCRGLKTTRDFLDPVIKDVREP